ncbi:MAG TPA: 30S ribosome-binding factor RbfA [Acidobacteriota bacterium]
MQHRSERVAEQIQAFLSEVLQQRFKDPRLGFVTLTEVRLSRDLRSARVYVSVLGDERQRQESLEALRRGVGFLRHQLAHGLKLRHTPTLTFVSDTAPARADRLQRLFDQLHPGPADDSGPSEGES